jgi:hypothetical protein
VPAEPAGAQLQRSSHTSQPPAAASASPRRAGSSEDRANPANVHGAAVAAPVIERLGLCQAPPALSVDITAPARCEALPLKVIDKLNKHLRCSSERPLSDLAAWFSLQGERSALAMTQVAGHAVWSHGRLVDAHGADRVSYATLQRLTRSLAKPYTIVNFCPCGLTVYYAAKQQVRRREPRPFESGAPALAPVLRPCARCRCGPRWRWRAHIHTQLQEPFDYDQAGATRCTERCSLTARTPLFVMDLVGEVSALYRRLGAMLRLTSATHGRGARPRNDSDRVDSIYGSKVRFRAAARVGAQSRRVRFPFTTDAGLAGLAALCAASSAAAPVRPGLRLGVGRVQPIWLFLGVLGMASHDQGAPHLATRVAGACARGRDPSAACRF